MVGTDAAAPRCAPGDGPWREPVYVVAIETSTVQASVAVGTEDGVLAEATLVRPRRHVEFSLPALQFCLDEAGVALSQVAGVAVGLGPGLFTGIRVGVAAARGLARAARIPVCGFASLDVLAFAARHTPKLVVPVIDARRGQVYYALYRRAPAGVQRLTPYLLGEPEDVAAELVARGEDVLLVGDGARAYPRCFDERGLEVGDEARRYPDARTLVELAVTRFEREEYSRPEELAPIYLRPPDAVIGWKGRSA